MAKNTDAKGAVDAIVDDETTELDTTTQATGLGTSMLPAIDGLEGMGFEELDPADLALRIPFITLMQPTSQQVTASRGKIAAGTFLVPADGDKEAFTVDSLKTTIIAFTKSRSMWSENFKRGDAPLCRSFDGKVMADGGIGSGDCSNCPYAKWDKDAGKSKCSSSYTLLCQDLETGKLFRLSGQGASYAPTRDFVQQLYKTARSAKASSFSFEVSITSEFQTNDKGSYYILSFPSDSIAPNHLLYTGKTPDHPKGFDEEYAAFLKDTYGAYIDSLKVQNQKPISETASAAAVYDPAADDRPF